MIKKIIVYLVGFFGASKSELIGYIPLLIISLVLLLVVIYLPNFYRNIQYESPNDLEEFMAWRLALEGSIIENDQKFASKNNQRYFNFNPNVLSADSLGLLGFKPWVAERIDNYRKAGGKFRVKGDLFKVYGIDSGRVESLWNAIELPDKLPQTVSTHESPIPKDQPNKVNSVRKPATLITKGLNQATAEEFQQIRGIGPAFSQRIVKYRALLGSYTTHDQLYEVYGLKSELVDSVKKYFHVDTVDHAYISINDISFDSLVKHPYINYNLARSIENFRIQHGRFEDAEALKEIKILPDSIFQKILPYLKIE